MSKRPVTPNFEKEVQLDVDYLNEMRRLGRSESEVEAERQRMINRSKRSSAEWQKNYDEQRRAAIVQAMKSAASRTQ